MALLSAEQAVAEPKAHAAPIPLGPSHVRVPETLDEPLRFHQRLFDSNEVTFGRPEAFVPRTAMLRTALRDLARADQPWLELPSSGMAENRYRGWLALLRDIRAEPRRVQVNILNRYVNAQPYTPDPGPSDDWRAPWEFLTGTGDCEEYALTKYVSLRHLGVVPERLRIVMMRDTARGAYHVLLALYLDDDILILDNRADAIASHREVRHMNPVYSFNEREIWFHWHDGEPAPTVFTPRVLQLATR